METFRKLANELNERVTEKHGVVHKIWIVHVPFCAVRYLNDARYLLGNTTQNSGNWQDLRQNSVKFLQSKSPSSPTEFSSFRTFSILTLRSISIGEVLLLYYENKYDFSYRREINKRIVMLVEYSVVEEVRVNNLHDI